ncbi:MAG: hypothetical protein JWO79_1363 [Actinomycetia bacterium]|jgi:hypothetical protein|nr:hypothetical protein [Actinomycetes bacterium]MDQ1656891.1 hypothetical protein [Cryptosporangiaceae bacterium]
MRHVLSLLAGLALAPVVWFLAALGDYRLVTALPRGAAAGGSSKELLLGVLLLLAGGLWIGILAGTRVSPAGSVAIGLVWLGAGAWFVKDPKQLADWLPDGPGGHHGLFLLPLEHGYAFVVGAAMMLPLISITRWRGARAPEEEVAHSPYGEPTAVARHDTGHLQPDRDSTTTGQRPALRSVPDKDRTGDQPVREPSRDPAPSRDSGRDGGWQGDTGQERVPWGSAWPPPPRDREPASQYHQRPVTNVTWDR